MGQIATDQIEATLRRTGYTHPKARKKPIGLNARSLIVLAKALNDSTPMSRPDLVELTGLNKTTVSKWVHMLYTAKLIYISAYRRVNERGNLTECFNWGFNRFDVVKPKRLTNAQYLKRYRDKKSREQRIVQTSTGVIHHAS